MKEDSGSYSRSRWAVLAVGCLAIMSCYMNVVAYAPLLGQIAADLKIDTGLAMNLVSATYIVTACALFVAGLFCDKFGLKAAILVSLLLTVVPAAFIPWVGHSFKQLLVARVFQGISPAFAMVIIGPITGLWFPPREQGLAGGLMMGSLSVGAAIGLLVSPVLAEALGNWQNAIVVLSILGWVGVASTFLMPSRPVSMGLADASPAGSEGQTGSAVKKAILSPVSWVGVFIFFFNAWGFHSLYALVPTYLAAPFPMGVGLSAVVSGRLSLALTLVGIFSVLTGGIFLDRAVKGNYRIVIAIGFSLSAVFSYLILIPAVFNNSLLLMLTLLVAGWGVPFMSSAIIAFAVTTYPVSIVGRMLGWLGGIGTFGGAAGVYFGGLAVAQSGNFNLAIGMISLAAVAGLGLSWFLKPRFGLKNNG